MVWHGQGGFCSVRVLFLHRNMITDSDDVEPEILKRPNNLWLGNVLGKFHLYGNLSNKGLDEIIVLVRIIAK